ncbi:MAG: Peptidoglycan-associated lipoprotein [Chlamydiia bacterium]|nr:Peptidoglycan-associated lipoprotein [Chlamydiia bacterium]
MRFRFLLPLLTVTLLSLTSCHRSSGSTWEDVKTLGRYIQRSSRMLFKSDADSKLISDREEFFEPMEDEFIPLNQSEMLAAEGALSNSRSAPAKVQEARVVASAKESNIPNIESFKNPSNELANIFKLVHFHTDSHVLQEREFQAVVDNIAKHMRANKELFVFVLGHCDERASEAYNLALGTRRAAHIRTLLVKKGVDPNHIFTISYGKEIPLDPGHNREAWYTNRRAEFKIYEKSSTLMR